MLPDRIKQIIRSPFFLYLLPLFFVLHGFTESYYLIPVPDSFLLLLKYLFATLVLNLIFFFIYMNNYRAVFFTFVLVAVYFFFGSFHDSLKTLLPGTFIVKYSFLLPSIFLIIVLTFFLIRRKKVFIKLTTFLNMLFLLF